MSNRASESPGKAAAGLGETLTSLVLYNEAGRSME
jgi:hypothetical protein